MLKKLGSKAGRFLVRAFWFFLGLWVSLGVFFTLPGPRWSSTIAALLVASAFYLAISGRRIYPALGITLVFGIFFFGFVKPDPNLNWTPDQARTPSVELEGDLVTVRNVRDFEWRSRTDFTPHYNDKTYDLRKLISMHYVVAPLGSAQAVAHVFLAFGFSDGQTVSISVEGRREEGKPYQVIPSLFRRFQLIYVVGEERDVVGLRGAIWKTTVQFYPLRSTQERKRALFLSMVNRAESLDENPEFYNLLTNNCMNNIVRHVRELGGPVLPRELALLLTGLSDSVAYDFGFLDTDLPFEKARVAYRVDPWMDTATLDEDFPRNLREQIDRQVREAENQTRRGGAPRDEPE